MLTRLKRFLLGWVKRKPAVHAGLDIEDRRERRLQRFDDIDARFGRFHPSREIELRLLQVGFVTSSDFVRVRAKSTSSSK